MEPSDPSGSDSVSDFLKVAQPKTVYRIGRSDNFACKNCNVRGDRFFMETHSCRGSK